MKKENPVECVGCNTFDVGTIIDNSNCTSRVERVYATEAEAQTALAQFSEKAQNAATEPCEIQSQITPVEQGFLLTADFTFSCQAESLIFELGLR
ncbi:YfcZ/YiiS family protein [Avibacterium paragallinarum]|uniref:YfcZ/YiiS family protein n=1 Tax=Avibacterium paragallinarum TaxID=728 RepID=UPI0021F714B8|nr:YfcZ/YiiS family protein [Avibacterium paragallinarum]UXN34604.1 YfcZ/YiiS family protein [Avibacterium paragallinarum]